MASSFYLPYFEAARIQNPLFTRFLFIISLLCICLPHAQAQDETEYSEEYTYGLNFNTMAGMIGGFDFKYAKKINAKSYRRFSLQIVNVKPVKELKVNSILTSQTFNLYKTNYLFAIRPAYGYERQLFKKSSEDGVHINLVGSIGPSFGVTKPYYVMYAENLNDPTTATSVPYKEGLDEQRIQDNGPFQDGFDQLKMTPGMHGKLGFSFEIGQAKSNVFGLELGTLFEYYFKPIEILAKAPRYQFLPTGYLTIYYGRKY